MWLTVLCRWQTHPTRARHRTQTSEAVRGISVAAQNLKNRKEETRPMWSKAHKAPQAAAAFAAVSAAVLWRAWRARERTPCAAAPAVADDEKEWIFFTVGVQHLEARARRGCAARGFDAVRVRVLWCGEVAFHRWLLRPISGRPAGSTSCHDCDDAPHPGLPRTRISFHVRALS